MGDLGKQCMEYGAGGRAAWREWAACSLRIKCGSEWRRLVAHLEDSDSSGELGNLYICLPLGAGQLE